jgi:hypothetical protein
MRKIINFIKLIYCEFTEHKPEVFLTETDSYISTKRCSRCKYKLGMPYYKLKSIPPPNSTEKQIKEWEEYCESMWQALRNGCKNK